MSAANADSGLAEVLKLLRESALAQPRLGEHSAEVLREAGLTESEIANMKSCGAAR